MLSALFAAAEPSKVPLYIAGALLVIWAVTVATVGIRSPNFPSSARGARAVMGVSFCLAALTVAMAIATSK